MKLNKDIYMDNLYKPIPKASHVFKTQDVHKDLMPKASQVYKTRDANKYDPNGVADIPSACFFTNLVALRDIKNRIEA